MNAQAQILMILFCFAASGFFSGTEIGLLSINHARLMHLVRAGLRPAIRLHSYLSNLQRCLATILVGNNLVNVMISTLSASLAQIYLPENRIGQTLWAIGMAFMMLFFCEYLPKMFFTTRPLRRTLLAIRPFYVIDRLLNPLTSLVLWLTQWLAPENRKGAGQRFLMTREYIQNVVSDAKEGSRITAFERLMINRVLTLQAYTAEQVMTPLARVTKTDENATLDSCYKLVRNSGHVRLPVFSHDGTTCVGILNVLDVLTHTPHLEQTRVRDCMQPPCFVNAKECADNVLPFMRQLREPMVMVRIAEGDQVLGIITEENVLSALTGSLRKVTL